VGQHADRQYPACISGHLAEPTAVTIPRVQSCDRLMTVTRDMNFGCMQIRQMCSRVAFCLLPVLFRMQPRMQLAAFATRANLLNQAQPAVHQEPHVFFCKVPLQRVGPQRVLEHGVIPPDVQDFALLSFELHETPLGPFLQPVEVPLNWQQSRLLYKPLLPVLLL